MNPTFIIWGLILITSLISFLGLQKGKIFEQYKYNVGAVKNGEYYRLLSSGFLHGDFMHLFFNMFSLYLFSGVIFHYFSTTEFLLIYFGSVLAGNIFTQFIFKNKNYYSAIGASGGVAGIIFASVMLDPAAVNINFLPGYLFGALYFGYSVYMLTKNGIGDGIGHAAHLGGAIFGMLYCVALKFNIVASNAIYTGIMSIPLVYLAYLIFIKKKQF